MEESEELEELRQRVQEREAKLHSAELYAAGCKEHEAKPEPGCGCSSCQVHIYYLAANQEREAEVAAYRLALTRILPMMFGVCTDAENIIEAALATNSGKALLDRLAKVEGERDACLNAIMDAVIQTGVTTTTVMTGPEWLLMLDSMTQGTIALRGELTELCGQAQWLGEALCDLDGAVRVAHALEEIEMPDALEAAIQRVFPACVEARNLRARVAANENGNTPLAGSPSGTAEDEARRSTARGASSPGSPSGTATAPVEGSKARAATGKKTRPEIENGK